MIHAVGAGRGGVQDADRRDLHPRPIHHQLEHRVEAHIFVAFLGYCLSVTLRMRLKTPAPGLRRAKCSPTLATTQMLDVQIPTSDGRMLLLPRYTEPTPEQCY
ncbi:MAG: hypothetical protein JNG88_11990 [Phycisphaerales bacterium]|nr:hypothetical protein [Phycisphaerales bacterium]